MMSLRSAAACRRLLRSLALSPAPKTTPPTATAAASRGCHYLLGTGAGAGRALTPVVVRRSDHLPLPSASSLVRSFATSGDDGGGGGGGSSGRDGHDPQRPGRDESNAASASEDEEDPFGVTYSDGEFNLGQPPPSYHRDATTGKFTGEIEAELTDEERRLLSATDVEKGRVVVDRFVKSWNDPDAIDDDGTGTSARQAEVAGRIRTEEMALNVLGRRASDVDTEKRGDDEYVDPDGFSAPLSPSEFATLKEYVRKEHGLTDLTEEDIPVARRSTSSAAGGGSRRGAADDAADPDLDLTWMTAAAQAEVGGDGPAADDPFVDLMPSDLNPARKVNRKRAKPLPKQLLHHNNLSLLRRYVTPGGQIMNRVQSRLGAKDQRKVAKLIKRARHLGLIPYLGQWKLEDHGNVHEEDIGEDREWEKDLVRRGLVRRERWREEE